MQEEARPQTFPACSHQGGRERKKRGGEKEGGSIGKEGGRGGVSIIKQKRAGPSGQLEEKRDDALGVAGLGIRKGGDDCRHYFQS